MIDSILEHNSNLLHHQNQQCCRVWENANNEIYQKSSDNKEKKLKKSPGKSKKRNSNRNNSAMKQNDKSSQNKDKN